MPREKSKGRVGAGTADLFTAGAVATGRRAPSGGGAGDAGRAEAACVRGERRYGRPAVWPIPMPDANQWRLVDDSDELLAPLYKAIERHAILNAVNLRIDDTGAMIIALRRQIQEEIAALQQLGEPTGQVRTGINATGVYIETEHATVVLFFTGRHHAGEIIDQLLTQRRAAEFVPLTQMILGIGRPADARRDRREG